MLFLALLACLFWPTRSGGAESVPPRGLILNLDFRHIQDGLIPCNTPYPLYVPLGGLGTKTFRNRTVLMIEKGQGLEIPHSSLLDPDGRGWVASIRIFATRNGVVLSQGNDQAGYTIFVKDGAVQASVQTGSTTVVLKETEETGITQCLDKWITIDLEIRSGKAILSLNRIRAATAPLEEPLAGKDLRIRLGEQTDPPAPGFAGAIGSLKLLRQ